MPVLTTTPYYVAPGGWDIENASYSGNSKNVGGKEKQCH